MKTGRSGMGCHKHGVSGYCGISPKERIRRMLEANRAISNRHKPNMYRTIEEAISREKCKP